MPTAIDTFVKERDEMLEKRSVQALIEFMQKWEKKGAYEKGFTKKFKRASEWVQMATLCKMICNVKKISSETKAWALDWLSKNGSRPEIF